MTLHVIRTDVLLHALGGLAEPAPPERTYLLAYPSWVSREVLRLAATPKTRYGEVTLLAERSGLSAHSLRVQISRARCGWHVPEYRRAS